MDEALFGSATNRAAVMSGRSWTETMNVGFIRASFSNAWSGFSHLLMTRLMRAFLQIPNPFRQT